MREEFFAPGASPISLDPPKRPMIFLNEPAWWPPISDRRDVAPASLERNPRAANENIIDNDPMSAIVREIMADRAQWKESASDLLQIGVNRSGWPKSPRALAGRLRGAETSARSGLRLPSAARGGLERA